MNPKLRRALFYICYAIGLFFIISMNSSLERRLDYQDTYQKLTDPIVDYQIAVKEGQSDIEKPDFRGVEIHLWRGMLDECLDPDIARWVMFGGFILVMLGGKAFEKSKPEQ